MSKEELKQQLIEEVVKEIKYSLDMGWKEAIEELLSFTPVENLIGYLPEECWGKYKSLNQIKNEG